MKKKFLKAITFIILCTISLFGCESKQVEMTEESKTYLAAVEEMVGFYEENPYMFYNCEEEDWNTALEQLKEDIKNNRVNEDEIYFRMQELSAILNNAHIYCFNTELTNEKVLPIIVKYYGNKLYIECTDSKYKELLGSEIISINGVKFKDIEERWSKIISAENPQHIKNYISYVPFGKSILNYLDIDGEEIVLTVKYLNGDLEKVPIPYITMEEYLKLKGEKSNYLGYENKRYSIENLKPEGAYDQYWFTLDEENRILYFQYNECIDRNYVTMSSMNEYSNYPDFNEFQKSFTEFINCNKDNFDKIVVDVSKNEGGNDYYIYSLINENLEIFNSKKVYAIMTKNTFSAGVCAVDTLVEKCNAIMVGEETGGSIELYGYNTNFSSSILPYIYYSGNEYKILYNAGKNTEDVMRGAIPDIEVDYTVEDALNGFNPYYQAVIDN